MRDFFISAKTRNFGDIKELYVPIESICRCNPPSPTGGLLYLPDSSGFRAYTHRIPCNCSFREKEILHGNCRPDSQQSAHRISNKRDYIRIGQYASCYANPTGFMEMDFLVLSMFDRRSI